MRILLDTHALIWFAEDSPRMPEYAKSMLEDPSVDKWFSIAGVWEVAIKHGLGKLALSDTPQNYLRDVLHRGGITLLPILFEHAVHAGGLDSHHRDPFDRLLVAQSMIEDMPVVSADSVLDAYGVKRYWNGPPAESIT